MSRRPRIVINGAFRPQRITGQQRYATEVSDRLALLPDVLELAPRADASSLQCWAWCQCLAARQLRRGQWLLSLTSRAPVLSARHVVVVHDLFVLQHPEWFSRTYARSHAATLRAQLAHAAAFVCVSQPVADDLRGILRRRRPIFVAPNAPAAAFSSPIESRTAERIGVVPGQYFLAVGTLEPRKNLATLIAAYSQLPPLVRRQFPMLVVGAASSHFADAGLATTVGVRYLDYIPDQQLAALYAASLATYFPTLAEGFGLPLVEALAAGAPVVVSDIPVLRWVGDDQATYISPLATDRWADDMMTRAEGGELRAGQAQRRRQRATQFDWERTAHDIFEFISSL